MSLLQFLCFLVGTVIFALFAVKVDLGTFMRWDFFAFFLWGVGFTLGHTTAIRSYIPVSKPE